MIYFFSTDKTHPMALNFPDNKFTNLYDTLRILHICKAIKKGHAMNCILRYRHNLYYHYLVQLLMHVT